MSHPSSKKKIHNRHNRKPREKDLGFSCRILSASWKFRQHSSSIRRTPFNPREKMTIVNCNESKSFKLWRLPLWSLPVSFPLFHFCLSEICSDIPELWLPPLFLKHKAKESFYLCSAYLSVTITYQNVFTNIYLRAQIFRKHFFEETNSFLTHYSTKLNNWKLNITLIWDWKRDNSTAPSEKSPEHNFLFFF